MNVRLSALPLTLAGGIALMAIYACGSVQERALVGQVDSGCDGAGGPVASATLRVMCPGDTIPRLEATSDGKGHFALPLASARIPVTCTLSVERAGFHPRSYLVSEVCIDGFETTSRPPLTTCERMSVAARLAPEAGAKP